MSTPPLTLPQALRAAGATVLNPDGPRLVHCGQPMHNSNDMLHRCTVCQITIQRLDSTNPASIPGTEHLWIVRQSNPSSIQP